MASRIEIPIKGMDCAGCVKSVNQAIEQVPGVKSVDVLLSAEKALIEIDSPELIEEIEKVIVKAGYRVPDSKNRDSSGETEADEFEVLRQKALRLFGIVFGAILLIVVAGEWFGLFDSVTAFIPFELGVVLVLLMGYPVFRKVVLSAMQGNVTVHALMTVGALAALIAGEWVTSAIVVFFMRTGDFIETYTTNKARNAVRSLTDIAPKTACVIRNGQETDIPISEVRTGDKIVVRPGGQIPVDGVVLEGYATVNQSAITGESMPVEVESGSSVYAATIAEGGRLLVKASAVGRDSTFGRIIRMIEEAETSRGPVQRYADQFSAWYLPVVALVAVITYLLSRDLMATVAVLVVACSCAFALATPIALLASIGSCAKKGLLIKGGKYLEKLAKADVLLIDKTGTLTFGQPEITDIIPLNGLSSGELLIYAASTEQYSEHPLARAVIEKARNLNLVLIKPDQFESMPGVGVKAVIDESVITVSNLRNTNTNIDQKVIDKLEKQGKTLMLIQQNSIPVGLLAARDKERNEIGAALDMVKELGIKKIELLTGDNKEVASSLADKLNIDFRAELLPEDKIRIVKQYQEKGHTVVMIGDGINDSPALAQADTGIAIGTTGTDIAIETAHITLMRDDWLLIPELIRTARKTMNVIKGNFGFTTLYNVVGLTLAAFGFLPPVLAAAAHSLPDIGILFNSSRLLER